MKILMLWNWYDDYLQRFYRAHPDLSAQAFEIQRAALLEDHFGWTGELFSLMRRRGIEAEFIVCNAVSMQRAWAEEHGLDPAAGPLEIWEAQVRHFRPDVLWMPYFKRNPGDLLERWRGNFGRAYLWCNSPIHPPENFTGFEAVLTSCPGLLDDAGVQVRRIIEISPGFDVSLIPMLPVSQRKGIVFAGSVGPHHARRTRLLAAALDSGLALEIHAQLQGRIPPGTALADQAERVLAANQGPLFGLEMYRRYATAAAVVNIHIDAADGAAANMRLFEATGAGACVYTELAAGMERLFEPGVEVLTYRTDDDFVEGLRRLSAEPALAIRIGRAGQERTLRSHTLDGMLDRLLEIWNPSSPA